MPPTASTLGVAELLTLPEVQPLLPPDWITRVAPSEIPELCSWGGGLWVMRRRPCFEPAAWAVEGWPYCEPHARLLLRQMLLVRAATAGLLEEALQRSQPRRPRPAPKAEALWAKAPSATAPAPPAAIDRCLARLPLAHQELLRTLEGLLPLPQTSLLELSLGRWLLAGLRTGLLTHAEHAGLLQELLEALEDHEA